MPKPLFVGLLCCLACLIARADSQPQQTAEQPQKLGPAIHRPVPITTPDARMPDVARNRLQNGICLVSLIVDVNGLPQNPRIIRCTDSIFEQNSLEAVQKYRFKPAYRISDRTPVPVMVTIEVNFRFGPSSRTTDDEPLQIQYVFLSPPGVTSVDPDAEGIYPLSKRLEPPTMKELVSKGFARAAMVLPDGTACDVVLVLSAKGKPMNATISKCDKSTLEQPAIDSLLNSKYRPAKFNGKEVPVRMLVHLVYEGFGPNDTNHGKP